MAQFPALPFWVDAYIADTEHLTDAEHGLYLKLLMIMWRSPKCRVPNDDAWLARRFKRSENDIANALRPLIAEFCQSTGNWLYQKRLQKEFQWCKAKSKKNTDAANLRWDKEKHSSERNAPIPIPIKKERKISAARVAATNGHTDPKADLYRRAGEVFGVKFNGKITQMLIALGDDVPRVRALVETSSGKGDPKAYFCAALRSADQDSGREAFR